MFDYHPNDNFIPYCKHLANHPSYMQGVPEFNVKLKQGDIITMKIFLKKWEVWTFKYNLEL